MIRSMLVAAVLAAVLAAGVHFGMATATADSPASTVVAARDDGGGEIPTWPFAVGTVVAVAVAALWAARRGR